MSEQFITKRDEVKALLRKLFRSEEADLDFGIYRIMNFKRREIEQFIERDLIEVAEAEFKQYVRAGTADLEKELERLRAEVNSDFGTGTIDSEGRVMRNHDAPKIQKYLKTQEEYREAALTEEQVNDVFNHIYEFFSCYYYDGDFIARPRDSWRSKYSLPYKGEEVTLHWATKNMYYIKTGEFFKKYSFKAGRYRVSFVLVDVQVETGNAKGENKFFILSDEEPVQLDEATSKVEIRFNYRELSDMEKAKYGTRRIQVTLVSEILEKMRSLLESSSIVGILRPRGGEEKSMMEKHLNAYVDRNTKDFFIHKDLKGFLERELDFYLKNEVWSLDELESSSESGARLLAAKVKAIRGISLKIIEFLSQIEEFQKKLFKKKKFILRTDYCITLDLVPEEFYEEIGKNEKQVEEWKRLFKLDEITKDTLYSTVGTRQLDTNFLKLHKYLVLDTKFFCKEFKDRFLQSFENLDEEIGGVIIKSENYHALNLLQDKYNEKVKCIYIDPPYNTGSDEFIYKDNYRYSSWLTMIENRLSLTKSLLKKESLLFSSIDNNEISDYIKLQKDIFGAQNLVEIIVIKNKAGAGAKPKGFISVHEYVTCFTLNYDNINSIKVPPSQKNISLYKKKDEKYSIRGPYGTWALETTSMDDRPNLRFPIIHNGEEIWPKKQWLWSKERVLEAQKNNDIVFNKKKEGTWSVRFKRYLRDEKGKLKTATPTSFFDGPYTHEGTKEIDSLFGQRVYKFPKPSNLIKKLIQSDINGNEDKQFWLIDFFAGSGTTAHAVLNLNTEDGGNRKYILVEMANYFDTVMIPRIQKVMFSKEWKDGLPVSTEGTNHMFKYMYLEQYEDTLNNILFSKLDGTIQETLDSFSDYFIRYMLYYETRDSPTRLSIEQFKTPFDYKIKTLSGGEELEEPVDLVETFNYLLGIHIKRIRTHKNGDRVYRAVFGERDREQVAVIWRDTSGLDLRRDKRFIEENILADSTFDTIYVNGDSYIRGAKPIEPEFRRLMDA